MTRTGWLDAFGCFLAIMLVIFIFKTITTRKEVFRPTISISKAKGKVVGYLSKDDYGLIGPRFYTWRNTEHACTLGGSQVYTIREFQGRLSLHKARCPGKVEMIVVEESNE